MPEPLPMPADDAYYNDSNCCCVVTGNGTIEQPYTISYCGRHEERRGLVRVIREYLAGVLGRGALLSMGGRCSS